MAKKLLKKLNQKEETEEYAVVCEVSDCKEVTVNDKVYEMPLKKGDKVHKPPQTNPKIKNKEIRPCTAEIFGSPKCSTTSLIITL